MNQKSRGLGKGLGAILGGVPDELRKPVGYVNKEILGARTAAPDTSDVLRIPVDMIESNPYQPRLSFDLEDLEELASSIKALGLIQPISVRKITDSRYQIISGERRYKACRLIGMTTVPAYIRDANDQGMLEMAIVENIQRKNLDPIEEALSYQRLIDECKLTQETMADRIGRKRATIANSLRLLNLPAQIQHDLKVGLVSVGHAKVLLGVSEPAVQEQLCDKVISEGWSVRQLEDAVRRLLKAGQAQTRTTRREEALPEEYHRMLSHIGRYFSKDISVKRSASGKGSMTIRFESDREVQAFLEALDKADL